MRFQIIMIINAKMDTKKLRLSSDKCYLLHISNKRKSKQKEEDCVSGFVHSSEMKKVKKAFYVGDILNSEGSYNDTIEDRKNRAVGISNQIMTIVSSLSLGMYHFQICFLLREAMFLNSLLINVEVWTGVSDQQINVLHKCDVNLMLKFYSSPRTVSQELLFLEGGKAPLKFSVSKRRLMYLYQILTRDKSELISKVYHSLILKPVKNDWFSMIEHEKKLYNINFTDEEISKMSKKQYKKIVYEKWIHMH